MTTVPHHPATDNPAPGSPSTGELTARAARVLPGGVSSNVRIPNASVFFERGEGARLWDTDGHEYVDYLLGQGPAFLGHAHPKVNEAVATAVGRGMVFGAQHALEVEAIEKMLEAIGWAEQARLGVSGTEAVQGALRIARAATGRRMVVRFAGQYHGWLDNVLMAFDGNNGGVASEGQSPDALAEWIVVPFNDLDALTRLFDERGSEIAAVITEPMMCNAGAIPPVDGFLPGLRDLTTRHGAVLIFDEVITGFRLARGGAAERFGVTPDLATYGKALAGGWPVSGLAGRAGLLAPVGTGKVNHSGTFNASVMGAAAVSATMDVLADDPPYERIDTHGAALMAGLEEIAGRHVHDFHLQGLPVAFHASFGSKEPVVDNAGLSRLDLARYAQFTHALARAGLWVAGRGIWYVSAAHGERELNDALERFDRALSAFTADP